LIFVLSQIKLQSKLLQDLSQRARDGDQRRGKEKRKRDGKENGNDGE
jgi:hypothetical protein